MKKQQDELTLIESFLYGDMEAFQLLTENYKDDIFNTLFYLLGTRVAKDRIELLAQEVFLEVYNNLKNLENKRAFTIWLYQLALKMANFELARIRSKNVQNNDEDYTNPEEEIEYLFTHKQEELEKESAKKYKTKEFRDLVLQAIDILPDEFRTVVVLRDIEQLTYEDISSILDMSPEVIKNRVFLAKIKLQKMLI
ncbi:MAG TPA: RNA polymerase sigma factor [Candidatus Eremiobacteraeota bacterium]|nr:MAG: ECF RNA polymerase sigma-E factor [bacterium ADurb.Bin363]HPZ08607.1 RNA polymerase sigma factor [Candidatus Eremiobacteraeota bacterium]